MREKRVAVVVARALPGETGAARCSHGILDSSSACSGTQATLPESALRSIEAACAVLFNRVIAAPPASPPRWSRRHDHEPADPVTRRGREGGGCTHGRPDDELKRKTDYLRTISKRTERTIDDGERSGMHETASNQPETASPVRTLASPRRERRPVGPSREQIAGRRET